MNYYSIMNTFLEARKTKCNNFYEKKYPRPQKWNNPEKNLKNSQINGNFSVPITLFIAFYKYIDLPLIFGLFENTSDMWVISNKKLGKSILKN